jgi:hypothetical protein
MLPLGMEEQHQDLGDDSTVEADQRHIIDDLFHGPGVRVGIDLQEE